MARFPVMIPDDEPEGAASSPDPMTEVLKALQEDRKTQREREARLEQEQADYLRTVQQTPRPRQNYTAPTPPYISQDEALADPVGTMNQIAAYQRQLSNYEVGSAVGPVLNTMADGLYESMKSSLAGNPYFKHAEAQLDAYFKEHPERHNKEVVREKLNSIVGANIAEFQRRVESEGTSGYTNAAPTGTGVRRAPVVEHTIQPPSPVASRPVEGSGEPQLEEREDQIREGWNKMYGLNIGRKEWQASKDRKIYPGESRHVR